MNDWWGRLTAAIIQAIAVENRSHEPKTQPIQDYKVSFSIDPDTVHARDVAHILFPCQQRMLNV